MELSGIQGFLEEYRKRLFKADNHRQQILRVINEISGVVVEEKDIDIKKHEVILHADMVAKNQIFLYKEKILKKFTEEGIMNIFDIR